MSNMSKRQGCISFLEERWGLFCLSASSEQIRAGSRELHECPGFVHHAHNGIAGPLALDSIEYAPISDGPAKAFMKPTTNVRYLTC